MSVLENVDFNNTVNRTVLDNGIRVVTERMPFVRSVSMGVWVNVGSCNETLQNNGISHFLEHMLFKGTHTRSAREIASSLEAVGGGLNGSTGKEISLYTAHSLDEHTEIAVDILSDIIINPKMDSKDIKLESQVILAEINHALEDPEELLLDNFYQDLYSDHPLGYFIYGSQENVSRFDSQELRNYLHAQYTTSKIVVAAAGNVEHEQFVDLVKKYFEKAVFSEFTNFPAYIESPNVKFNDIKLDTVQQGHLCLGVRTFGYNDDRKYPLVLLDILLGGGMSSRLFQNIREKYGFAYNVYSFTDIMRDTGVFGVYMACAQDKIDQSIELVKSEFNKILKKPISNIELDKIKSHVKGNLILGLESSGRRMRKIGENEIYSGHHNSIETIIQKIDAVTPNDLTDLANQVFTESNFTLTMLTPC